MSTEAPPKKYYKKIVANNSLQKNYIYYCTEPMGKNFDPRFKPAYTPKQMMKMGIFSGAYWKDCVAEFPQDWLTHAKQSKVMGKGDASLNYFSGYESRLSLKEWQRRGWIPCAPGDQDFYGWYMWYWRYFLGRRIPNIDDVQIKRWMAIKRHYSQVIKNCKHPKDAKGHCTDPMNCRPRQRLALLQWSWPCLD
jgi:hypothetical protein